MLFNVLGSMLEKSAAVQTFSAIRANPGALTHVGQSVYAKAAERGFLPLAVLLAMAQRYVDNTPLPAQPAGVSMPSGRDMAAAMGHLTAEVAKRRQAGKPVYLDLTTDRWMELFSSGGLLGALLPTSQNGQGAVAVVDAKLACACEELVEAQQANKALRKEFLIESAEQDADLDDMDSAYTHFLQGHGDIRLRAVEQVFTSLLEDAQADAASPHNPGLLAPLKDAKAPSVDPFGLVFNLVAVLGDPADWSALQAAFFERILLSLGVLPQHVDAMRGAQASYRRTLAEVTAVLTPSEKD